MDNQTPTDLFIQHHQFKTQLMIDTIAQVHAGLKSKKIKFTEESIINIAADIWQDSLDLIQESKSNDVKTFIIEDGDDFQFM